MKMVFSFLLCIVLQVSVVSIKAFSSIFKATNLPFNAWAIALLLAVSPLFLVEIEKILIIKTIISTM